MVRKFISLALLVALLLVGGLALSQPAQAATVKAGQSCSKLNKTTVVNFAPYRKKTFKCQKKGAKKVWVLKSTTPALGASGNPVPFNVPIKLGQFIFQVTGFEDDRSDIVCGENGFNSGCGYDSNTSQRIVDPAATGRWVRLAVTVTNTAADAEPYVARIGTVVAGKMTWSTNSSPVASDRIDSRLILQGQTDSGFLYAYVDKAIIPDRIVLSTSYWSTPTFMNIR